MIIHTYHGHVLSGYFGPVGTAVFRTLERLLARVSDCLIGVSQATVDELVAMRIAPRERFRVIRLGIDMSRFLMLGSSDGQDFRRELGLGDDDVLAVFVGRLVPIKRVEMLLDAVARARRSQLALHLAVVGDGELRPALERQAAERGLGSAVSFVGYRSDLEHIVAAADIAVLSSANEGTPVALIEAAAAGKPAVATDVGGVSEIVTPETGRVVPSADTAAFAQALSELSSDCRRSATVWRCGEHACRARLRRRAAGRGRRPALPGAHDKSLTGSPTRDYGRGRPALRAPTRASRRPAPYTASSATYRARSLEQRPRVRARRAWVSIALWDGLGAVAVSVLISVAISTSTDRNRVDDDAEYARVEIFELLRELRRGVLRGLAQPCDDENAAHFLDERDCVRNQRGRRRVDHHEVVLALGGLDHVAHSFRLDEFIRVRGAGPRRRRRSNDRPGSVLVVRGHGRNCLRKFALL